MNLSVHLPKVKAILKHRYTLFYGVPAFIILISLTIYFFTRSTDQEKKLLVLGSEKVKTEGQLRKQNQLLATEVTKLKNIDEHKRNDALEKDIKSIESTYGETVKIYEKIQDLKAQKKDTAAYEKQLILTLSQLSKREYDNGEKTLTALTKQISDDEAKAAAAAAASSGGVNAANVPVNNSAPGSGFSQQKVHSDAGDFVISIVAADMGSTRVILDTATDGDCHDNCPVMALGDYVARNGAFAGINGSYFCPATYTQCAGKTNSFDLLAMNKNKHYINSDNNVYSTNPVVIFQSGSMRFLGQASGWGRDTGVDGVLSNYPLLVSGGNVVFGGDDDPKKGSIGSRSFVGNKGGTAYIGVVYGATVAQAAHALKALGLDNALNLDSGGSTALWFGGYKAGPGRNLPNAILFVRK